MKIPNIELQAGPVEIMKRYPTHGHIPSLAGEHPWSLMNERRGENSMLAINKFQNKFPKTGFQRSFPKKRKEIPSFNHVKSIL
jgi:hypothetical protein